MAADLAQRLAQQELVARTVGIKMRLEDWTLLTRERTVPDFLSDAPRLAAIAGELMREHWQRRPIRLIGLRVSGLCPKPDGSQLALYATMPAELPERAV
jgi:DNA polymerase-4